MGFCYHYMSFLIIHKFARFGFISTWQDPKSCGFCYWHLEHVQLSVPASRLKSVWSLHLRFRLLQERVFVYKQLGLTLISHCSYVIKRKSCGTYYNRIMYRKEFTPFTSSKNLLILTHVYKGNCVQHLPFGRRTQELLLRTSWGCSFSWRGPHRFKRFGVIVLLWS